MGKHLRFLKFNLNTYKRHLFCVCQQNENQIFVMHPKHKENLHIK